jgi:hypothetical protein
MAEIYTNSHCTITTAGAINCQQGCYATRSPLEFAPRRIIRTDSSLQHIIRLQHRRRRTQIPPLCRGIDFQERMLSPRVLYFSNQGIIFNRRCIFDSEMDSPLAFPLQPTGRKHFDVGRCNL